MIVVIAMATATVLVLDGIWLTLMKPQYSKLVQGVQHSPLTLKLWPAVLSYICVVVGIVFFAYPLAKAATNRMSLPLAALTYGGGLGLVVYGIWNFTNMAVFKDYNLTVGLMDLSWGIVLFTAVVYLLVWSKY